MKNGLTINEDGSKFWYLNGEKHRVDGPAEEYTNGSKFWYLNGKKHRVDGPAEEFSNGSKCWFLNSEQHRIDGPAEEWADGSTCWFLNGKIHRVDGPAIEYENGEKFWYVHGTKLICPKEFKNMEECFEHLNANEEYSLPWIHNINGLIEVIKNPTDKQKRLHAMKWKL